MEEKYVVTLGEYMLRLKSPDKERFFQSPIFEASFGGSEGNVAISLANLGLPTIYITALPQNAIGDAALRFLRSYNVITKWISRKGKRMGIYFLEIGSGPRSSNVIYDRENSAISVAKYSDFNWNEIWKNAMWFHTSGITPAISKSASDLTYKVIKDANSRGIKTSLDLNYRRRLWKWGASALEIMPKLTSLVDIIIANEEDIQLSLGLEIDQKVSGTLDKRKYKMLAQMVFDTYSNVKIVAITLRESFSADHNRWSALLAVKNNKDNKIDFFQSKTFELTNIVDRVGAGDSFAAGLIYSLINNYSYQDAVDFAVCASALKHTIPGDANLVSATEIKKIMQGNSHGRVQR
ncbi:MAG: PfkB family carbohydrate kinase [Promethearchaeota archaeon]